MPHEIQIAARQDVKTYILRADPLSDCVDCCVTRTAPSMHQMGCLRRLRTILQFAQVQTCPRKQAGSPNSLVRTEHAR